MTLIEERVGTSLRRKCGTIYLNKGKWVAEIVIDNVKHRIGRFQDRKEAVYALDIFLKTLDQKVNIFLKALKNSSQE